MSTKTIIATGIATVTFLLTSFGNFLLDIAPPGETDSRFAIGISSFLMLFLLLFISAIIKNQSQKKMKKIWLRVSMVFFTLAVMLSLTYKINLNKLTFRYPPEQKKAEHIAGTRMTADAEQFLIDNPLKTTSEIVAAYEGLAFIERVWTDESIRRSKLILTVNYVALVLCVAIMLFCLTEGILVPPKENDK